MPVEEENKLKRSAAKKGLTGEHADAYVYGTLRKMGWKPGHQGTYKNDEVDHSPQTVINHKD